MTEIAVWSDTVRDVDLGPGLQLSSTSLDVVDPTFTFGQFESALHGVTAAGDSVRWWLGDLLVFGEARFGEEYAQALDGMRLSEHQLRRYRWVAERISPVRRRENLSFSHHQEVAALEPVDQERLLAIAEEGQLSVAALRDAMADIKEPPPKSKRRQTVLPAGETVDAARGLTTIRDTLGTVSDVIETREGREAVGIPASMRALDDVGRTVKRVPALEGLAIAVGAVMAAGVQQKGLADPAVIVPSGPWASLAAAYERAIEGGNG